MYEESEEYEEGGGSSNKILILVIILLLIVIAGAAVYFFFFRKTADEDKGIGYATEIGVVVTQEELDAAMAEAARNASMGNVALRYRNNAYSDDGINFECLLMNSESNLYDAFIGIYSDLDMTDQLYLSGLLPPGTGYDKLTLDHSLEKGDHTVYVVITQVDRDDEGEEYIVNQVTFTMDFHVS